MLSRTTRDKIEAEPLQSPLRDRARQVPRPSAWVPTLTLQRDDTPSCRCCHRPQISIGVSNPLTGQGDNLS